MSWQDFETASSLERDTLERALPLVETEMTGESKAVLNLTGVGDPGRVFIKANDFGGLTPEACIDFLQVRPLLFGTAWKVLDLLFEEALGAASEPPDLKNGRWSIARKVTRARAAAARPAAISPDPWRALMSTYAATDELRHCLVHRRVSTDASEALIWHDEKQGKPRQLTREEQEAFVRAVLRAAQLVLAPVREERLEDDLLHQLGLLASVHKVALGPVPQNLRPSRLVVTIPADAAVPGNYVLDVPRVKALHPWPDAAWTDLIVQLHGRPGHELRGRLEHDPVQVVSLDPAAPPSWLS